MGNPRSKPFGSIWVVIAGGLATGIGTALVSGDWVCTAMGGAVAGAFLVALLEGLAGTMLRRRPSWRRTRTQQVVPAAIAVCLLTTISFLSARDSVLFEEAFAIRPPEGVVKLRARSWLSGPGDQINLVRFRADREAIEKIISARPLVPAEERLQPLQEGVLPWQNWWRSQMGIAKSFDDSWLDVPPMAKPEVYEWGTDASGVPERVILIWDANTGQAYAIYLFG